jgi:hypothetical protein
MGVSDASAVPPAWAPHGSHDLRHTCVTLLLDLGAPSHVVQEIVGHSDIEVTMTMCLSTKNARHSASLEKIGSCQVRVPGRQVSSGT